MDPASREDLIYDWNTIEARPRPSHAFELVDETLRDGLQSPSVKDPPLTEKIKLLHLMHELGIQNADIGLPGAGGKMSRDCLELAREIERAQLAISPNCAARTHVDDIRPVVELNQRVGIDVAVSMFIGSSAIRQYAEDWPLEKMLSATEKAVTFAKENGLTVIYVTEDTTRARPDTLEKLYGLAIDLGADRIILADTVGHAIPEGVHALVSHIKRFVESKGRPVGIEWHGHMDRGLGVINSLAAIEAGCDRAHATAAGIGERTGNTPMDTLLVNLKLLGWIDNDLRSLGRYLALATDALGVSIPKNYPVFGADAFETATGVHASAVYKALKKGDAWLANRVYSSVPADEFGLKQNITIGPMSGKSNALFWLEKNGVDADSDVIEAILDTAKSSREVLTDEKIRSVIDQVRASR